MKTSTSILTVTIFVTHVCGYLIQVPTTPVLQPRITAPTQWIRLQKLVNPLFENICEVSNDSVIKNLAQEFTIIVDDYEEPDAIREFQDLISNGLTPKGEIFTEYNPTHMNELKIVYKVLYYAKNFDVFYKVAAWARQNMNCALYVSTIYMALQNRKDTERLSIPAPYELIPNYFIRKDVIATASSLISGQIVSPVEGVREDGNGYTLDANYTALFYDNDEDSKLAYFREDVGLNSFYFFKKLSFAPWLNQEGNESYGENLYHFMKQLMSRYSLERYANGFAEVESINWDKLPNIPYDPMLIYSNGNEFSYRTMPLNLPLTEDIELIKRIENNIEAVVSHMIQSGYNKTRILNHLMEILFTSEESYETLARKLLGKDLTNNGYASVLEHDMTSLRDPIFWMINKKIVDIVDSALQLIPSYTKSELYFPGVQVMNIEVKKMMTACDYFEFDVTDALKIDDTSTIFNIKVGQPRLNHKPFTIRVNVSSLVSQKGLVKVYIGPKLLPGELATKKYIFTLIDSFEVNLKVGTNLISRTSDQMQQFSEDLMSLPVIRKNTEDAEFGLDALPFKTIASQIAYPSRLIFPKGSPQGLSLQMFVFVAPFSKASVSNTYLTNSMEFNSAILSPGYPLDLPIEDNRLFDLPNALIKYVTITQKSDSKVENYGGPGITKSWYGTDENSYDPSSRVNYASKDPYDGKFNNEYYQNDFTESRSLSNKKIDYKSKNKDFNKYKTPSVEKITTVPNSMQFDSEENIKDNSTKFRLLTSPKFDYSSKVQTKKTFDYKTKKEQNKSKKQDQYKDEISSKPNPNNNAGELPESDEIISNGVQAFENDAKVYASPVLISKIKSIDFKSAKSDYNKKTTDAPIEEFTSISSVKTYEFDDDGVKKTIQINKEDNTDSEKVEKKIHISDITEPIENSIDISVENDSTKDMTMTRRRKPTVYDFLFYGLDYDDTTDSRVYE